MDLESLIEELEILVQRAVNVPGGKALVDAATLRQIVHEMRGALQEQAQMGQRLTAERDRILADARAQAARILDEARGHNEARLEDQAVVQIARQRAKEIQGEAEQRAAALRADASHYVMGQLGALEARLQRLLREVQAGQRSLGPEREAQ